MTNYVDSNEMKRILLAEDDPVLRATMEELLCEIGYQVISVDNAMDAIGLFVEGCNSIHMLITDICMPEAEDGIGLIKNIRRLDSKLPIIVTTSYDKYQSIDKDFNLNTVIFKKPFKFSELHDYLNKAHGAVCSEVKFDGCVDECPCPWQSATARHSTAGYRSEVAGLDTLKP